MFDVSRVFYIVYGRVTLRQLGIVFKSVENFPSPLLILRLPRDGKHVEERLDGFGTQEVVTIGRLDIYVIFNA